MEVAPFGRKFSVFIRGDNVITLWVDYFEKEIRVVNVEFVWVCRVEVRRIFSCILCLDVGL